MKQAEIDAWNWARGRNLERAREEWAAGRTNNALELFAASSASPVLFRNMIDRLTQGLEVLNENRDLLLHVFDPTFSAIGDRIRRKRDMRTILEEITGLPDGEMTGKEVSLDTRDTYRYLIDQLSILAAKALT